MISLKPSSIQFKKKETVVKSLPHYTITICQDKFYNIYFELMNCVYTISQTSSPPVQFEEFQYDGQPYLFFVDTDGLLWCLHQLKDNSVAIITAQLNASEFKQSAYISFKYENGVLFVKYLFYSYIYIQEFNLQSNQLGMAVQQYCLSHKIKNFVSDLIQTDDGSLLLLKEKIHQIQNDYSTNIFEINNIQGQYILTDTIGTNYLITKVNQQQQFCETTKKYFAYQWTDFTVSEKQDQAYYLVEDIMYLQFYYPQIKQLVRYKSFLFLYCGFQLVIFSAISGNFLSFLDLFDFLGTESDAQLFVMNDKLFLRFSSTNSIYNCDLQLFTNQQYCNQLQSLTTKKWVINDKFNSYTKIFHFVHQFENQLLVLPQLLSSNELLKFKKIDFKYFSHQMEERQNIDNDSISDYQYIVFLLTQPQKQGFIFSNYCPDFNRLMNVAGLLNATSNLITTKQFAIHQKLIIQKFNSIIFTIASTVVKQLLVWRFPFFLINRQIDDDTLNLKLTYHLADSQYTGFIETANLFNILEQLSQYFQVVHRNETSINQLQSLNIMIQRTENLLQHQFYHDHLYLEKVNVYGNYEDLLVSLYSKKNEVNHQQLSYQIIIKFLLELAIQKTEVKNLQKLDFIHCINSYTKNVQQNCTLFLEQQLSHVSLTIFAKQHDQEFIRYFPELFEIVNTISIKNQQQCNYTSKLVIHDFALTFIDDGFFEHVQQIYLTKAKLIRNKSFEQSNQLQFDIQFANFLGTTMLQYGKQMHQLIAQNEQQINQNYLVILQNVCEHRPFLIKDILKHQKKPEEELQKDFSLLYKCKETLANNNLVQPGRQDVSMSIYAESDSEEAKSVCTQKSKTTATKASDFTPIKIKNKSDDIFGCISREFEQYQNLPDDPSKHNRVDVLTILRQEALSSFALQDCEALNGLLETIALIVTRNIGSDHKVTDVVRLLQRTKLFFSQLVAEMEFSANYFENLLFNTLDFVFAQTDCSSQAILILIFCLSVSFISPFMYCDRSLDLDLYKQLTREKLKFVSKVVRFSSVFDTILSVFE